jgi:hypothetical protein
MIGHCTELPSGVQNIAVENIFATAIYPCPFAVRCDWSGIPFEIGRHVVNSRRDNCVTVNETKDWIRIFESPYQKAILTLNKLFFSSFSRSENDVHFAVFHVGHRNDSSGYINEFKIGNSYQIHGVCYHYQDGENMCVCVYLPRETQTILRGRSDMPRSFLIREVDQPMEWTNIPTYQAGGSNYEADIPI